MRYQYLDQEILHVHVLDMGLEENAVILIMLNQNCLLLRNFLYYALLPY